MTTTFTQYHNHSIWSIDSNNTDPASALEYLNNPENFRSFSSGLTELICKYGYEGSLDDPDAKSRFLLSKLSLMGISITKPTISSWFRDKHRPSFSSESRKHMYRVCFALSASLEDIKWFFGHVYFDKAFNCHTLEEAVYYYCFSHQLPYCHAQNLISMIQAFPEPEAASDTKSVFTKYIVQQIDHCTTDEELLSFFKENKHIFNQWNITAKQYIAEFNTLIRGKKSDKTMIDAFRSGKSFLTKDFSHCGLVIQEYLLSAADGRLDYISGKSIDSVDFMLERIITFSSGLHKQTQIPLTVRRNFPSKKTFSDILNNAEHSTSYDSIRKCLVLLKFYHFWATLLLHPDLISDNNYFDIFCDETNALLTECGYEELFAGNPYDWLFLWASTSKEPLDALRRAISSIEDT